MTTPLQALVREAIIYTLPLYEMARMSSASGPRKNPQGSLADPAGGPESSKRWVNVFTHTRQLLGPQDRRVVTPNNDTLYTNAWLDLSRGPMLLHAPDTHGRYYVLGFLDFYTNPFAYSGSRTTGTGAQVLFVHGPAWRGTVPKGTIEIASPTDHVWVLGRILATQHEDLTPVHALQNQFLVKPAAQPDAPFAGDVVDTGIQPRDMLGDPATFVRVVNRALALNPPPPQDAAMVARFAAVGIGAQATTSADLPMLGQVLREVLAELDQPRSSNLGGGWSVACEITSSFGQDWWLRALVARGYIGMLGVEEVVYVMADVDATGTTLEGVNRYRLRFPPGGLPQAGAFWSITMYRKSDYLLVDNPIQRYSIGDRTPDLVYDGDGGLTITMSHHAPTSQANWLPAPAEPFYVTLRIYLPSEAHLTHRYVYPAIEAL